ncbi:MAG: hypothetical protein U0269_28530 [Polyangiales bacterium]
MAQIEPLRVVHNDGVLTLGTLGPVCIYLYRDLMTSAHVARGRALHKSQFKLHPDGLGVLIIYRTPRYIGSEMTGLRDEFVALMREANELVKHVSVVIEETGFLGATIRASASGLSMLARPKFSIKYLPSSAEAIASLVTQMKQPSMPNEAAIRTALEEMDRLPKGVLVGA